MGVNWFGFLSDSLLGFLERQDTIYEIFFFGFVFLVSCHEEEVMPMTIVRGIIEK